MKVIKKINNLKDLAKWCRQFKGPTTILMPINLWETFALEIAYYSLVSDLQGKIEVIQIRDNVRIIPI